jgi:hypothetical protein
VKHGAQQQQQQCNDWSIDATGKDNSSMAVAVM